MTEKNQAQQPLRLDQRLAQEINQLLKSLLDEFPELRTAAIVLDYEMDDPGSLPSSQWLPRRPLEATEVLRFCQRVDTLSYMLRRKHDEAVARHVDEYKKGEVKDGE